MISIIIPVYNEEKVIQKNLDYYTRLVGSADVIFVDGGSTDQTQEIIKSFNGNCLNTTKNRAHQMNLGASESKGDKLLFLHADTQIQLSSLPVIERVIDRNGFLGGCLSQRINKQGMFFRWIAFTGNVRARITKVFNGDQGIFVTKSVFNKVGGFPVCEIAEGVYLTKQLRRLGKLKVLPDLIYCSPRRWIKQGIVKTTILNLSISLRLTFGLNADQLAGSYQDIR